MRTKLTVGEILQFLILVGVAIVFLTPFYVIVRNALLSDTAITSFNWVWLPIPPEWSNLGELFSDPSAPTAVGLRNSAVIAITQLVFQMLFASMAGYGLARIRHPASNLVFLFIISTMTIPFAVTFVPLYIVV
ncbi:MAG TPA: carbohydrate ABC transporter permease, partial [Chloroflexota bacterium]|nr:carbohydrate ABC transporter permease [Chloroflexota bacterium]